MSENHELLTVDEAAELLRTTRKAVYAAAERGQLPGVVKLGRRLLFRSADLRARLGLVEGAPSSEPTRNRVA